jgi:hypothetical protein
MVVLSDGDAQYEVESNTKWFTCKAWTTQQTKGPFMLDGKVKRKYQSTNSK